MFYISLAIRFWWISWTNYVKRQTIKIPSQSRANKIRILPNMGINLSLPWTIFLPVEPFCSKFVDFILSSIKGVPLNIDFLASHFSFISKFWRNSCEFFYFKNYFIVPNLKYAVLCNVFEHHWLNFEKFIDEHMFFLEKFYAYFFFLIQVTVLP